MIVLVSPLIHMARDLQSSLSRQRSAGEKEENPLPLKNHTVELLVISYAVRFDLCILFSAVFHNVPYQMIAIRACQEAFQHAMNMWTISVQKHSTTLFFVKLLVPPRTPWTSYSVLTGLAW